MPTSYEKADLEKMWPGDLVKEYSHLILERKALLKKVDEIETNIVGIKEVLRSHFGDDTHPRKL